MALRVVARMSRRLPDGSAGIGTTYPLFPSERFLAANVLRSLREVSTNEIVTSY